MRILDRWREIVDVLARRKLRTALTALSVAWGIFMLVALLAAGNGLASGIEASFSRDATDSVWVNPGVMSKPFAGNPVGRPIFLDDADRELVPAAVPFAENLSASVQVGERTTRHGARQGSFTVVGCEPPYEFIERLDAQTGRFLNAADLAERRKVVVLGRKVAESLFAPGDDPRGADVTIGSAVFQVVGVVADESDDWSEQAIFMPLSTARLALGTGARIGSFSFTVGAVSVEDSEAAMQALIRLLAARKNFAPDDKRAVRIWNNRESSGRFQGLFAGIRLFVWIIGLGTILAGVVGVSNIMLISVAERTREIGVRKAIGAKPAAIVLMIVEEAIVITLVSGYLGLVAAVAAVTAAGRMMPKTEYFATPVVDLGVGLAATAVLVVAGTLAGLFPARRAARVNPIVALRTE